MLVSGWLSESIKNGVCGWAASEHDVSDDDTRDAASSAVEHFVELIQILDEAMTKAALLADSELLERVAKAKAAAERSKELMDKFRSSVPSGDEERSC